VPPQRTTDDDDGRRRRRGALDVCVYFVVDVRAVCAVLECDSIARVFVV